MQRYCNSVRDIIDHVFHSHLLGSPVVCLDWAEEMNTPAHWNDIMYNNHFRHIHCGQLCTRLQSLRLGYPLARILPPLNSQSSKINVVTRTFIGASLSEPQTSVTALSMCVCIYHLCILGLTTYRKFHAFKILNISQCPHGRILQLSCENEHEGVLPDCRINMKESESKDDFNLNATAARTTTYFLNYGESDDHVTRQATSDRQQDVRWLQVRAWHDRSYTAGAHGLTVKLSPCLCSHSSPAGQIACVGIPNTTCYSLRLTPG